MTSYKLTSALAFRQATLRQSLKSKDELTESSEEAASKDEFDGPKQQESRQKEDTLICAAFKKKEARITWKSSERQNAMNKT